MGTCELKKGQKEDIPGTEENTCTDIQKETWKTVVMVIVMVRGSFHGSFKQESRFCQRE